MPQPRWFHRSGRRLVHAAVVTLLSACGGGGGGGLVEPTTGAIAVTTSTTGSDLDPDGYTLTVDEVESGVIGAAAQRTIGELAPGAHRVGLTGVSPNCEVQGENPRTVSVVAGETSSEAFAVVCTEAPPATGGLSVAVTTTGVAPDPDGYTVTVDGADRGSVDPTGSLAVADLGAGDHLVGLGGVAANCTVAGDNPRTVAVVAGVVVSVAFSVACEAPPTAAGTVTVTTTTRGDGVDPDGYAFAINGGAAQPIGADASVSVAGVAAGATEVELSGLADNCQLAGTNPRSMTVPAGATVEVTFAVTCAAGSGTLVVTTASSGSPPDQSGYTLSVDGAAAVAIGINTSLTFQDVAPGVHTVRLGGVATNCQVQGQNPRSATVTAGQTTTLTFTVECSATTGALTVTVGGLPATAAAAVTVTGPGGFSREVTATTTLDGLVPGEYTVTAASVTTGGATYAATPTTRTASVAAGGTARVTVTYAVAPGSTLNLTIAGMHLTQSVQTFDNAVPLVAGRDALVRVTALANGSNQAQPQVRVRLYRGNTLAGTVLIPAPSDTVPTGRSDGELTTTWNTRVAGSLIQPGLQVVADVDPTSAIAEANENDNVFPATGRLRPAVLRVPALAVMMVPVRQSATGLVGEISDGSVDGYLDLASRMYPLSDYDAAVRQTYTTSAPALQPDDANGGWLTVLNEMEALRAADPSGRQYYGVVKLNYASGLAGMAFIGLGTAIGYDHPSDRGRIMAHELGHTWGREHAPCGNPAGPDPGFPYAGGRIGRIGWDPRTGLLRARESPDIMGYCANPWVSDYTYGGVMDFRDAASGRSSGAAGPALLVWGRIVDGRAVLEPAFRIVARARLPRRPGPYAVEGFAADGSRVFGLSFDAAEVADDPRGRNARQFAFAVPLDEGAASRLEQIRLTGPGVGMAAASRPPAALRAGRREPVRMAPVADGVSLQWDARAHPMVMVRDSRTGEVLSFARGGSATVAATGSAVELIASDGVRSGPVAPVR